MKRQVRNTVSLPFCLRHGLRGPQRRSWDGSSAVLIRDYLFHPNNRILELDMPEVYCRFVIDIVTLGSKKARLFPLVNARHAKKWAYRRRRI